MLEQDARLDEVEPLQHGVDAHREQLLEVDVAERLVGADLDRLLDQDRAFVEAFVGPEDGEARARLAHGDRPVDRRRPAVRGQQRRVILERAEPRRVEHRLRNEQQHIGHQADVGVERLHQLERFRRLPALRLVDGEALLALRTASADLPGGPPCRARSTPRRHFLRARAASREPLCRRPPGHERRYASVVVSPWSRRRDMADAAGSVYRSNAIPRPPSSPAVPSRPKP